jgi:hypothetical protein
MSATPSNFAGDCRYCNRDKRVIFNKTVGLGPSQTIGCKIMITHHSAEIRVRRYDGIPECDVVVSFRGHAMTLRCRNYDQAVVAYRMQGL